MGFLDKAINGIYDIRRAIKGEPRLWHTAFGDIQLAGKGDRRKVKSVLAKLQRTTEALTKGDMQKWRRAWQQAIDVDSPNRQWLYDIYRDTDIDAHLSGCIGQRVGFVLARSFNIETRTARPTTR